MKPERILLYPTIKSVGLGLTNQCNLNCPHCYSRNLAMETITLPRVKKISSLFPGMTKVNFGTGESILNKELVSIMAFFREKGVEMALTSNGLTVAELDDQSLSWFKDIDLSLDFPEARFHDQWRSPGAFNQALKNLERLKKLGLNVSIALCLMNNNYQQIAGFRKIIDRYEVALRINLYKPTSSDQFSLDYNQFWQAIKILADNFCLVCSSEPILAVVGANEQFEGGGCGQDSVRIHPDGTISPCVFVAGAGIGLAQWHKLKAKVPKFCVGCQYVDFCRGGCLARRVLGRAVDQPDEFCPLYRNLPLPKIEFTRTTSLVDFIHANYLCTLIVQ